MSMKTLWNLQLFWTNTEECACIQAAECQNSSASCDEMPEASNNMHWPPRKERLQCSSHNKSVQHYKSEICSVGLYIVACFRDHAQVHEDSTSVCTTTGIILQSHEYNRYMLFFKLLITYASTFHKGIITMKFCNAMIHNLFSSWHYLFHNFTAYRLEIYRV
jgi:hypothetical protein